MNVRQGERVALQLDTCNLLGLVTYALHTQSPVSRRNDLVLKLANNNIPAAPQTANLGSLQFRRNHEPWKRRSRNP